jgi:hypothetical protein
MPNPSIESVLRRELDSLPLPPEFQWVPTSGRGSGWSTTLWFATGVAVIALALVSGPALRDWRDSRSEGVAARPTPLVLPTVIDGIGISPLRNISQHPDLGFNLLVPANWRETERTSFTVGALVLIGRATYTAHARDAEAALLSRYGASTKLPWDVVVELWAAGGMTAREWARGPGGCGSGCALGTTTISGSEFVTSVDSATGAHAFYVLRGDRILVLSYMIGNAAERPEGVTADTVDQIVRSVGLP